MKIQIKQAMTLIENETGGYSAEVRNIFIDGNKIVSLDQAPEGFVSQGWDINGKKAELGIAKA